MLQPQGCTHLHVLHLDRLLVKHGHVGRLVHAVGTQRGGSSSLRGEGTRTRGSQARSKWVWGEHRAARQKACGSCLPCWWGPQAGPARRQPEPPSQASNRRSPDSVGLHAGQQHGGVAAAAPTEHRPPHAAIGPRQSTLRGGTCMRRVRAFSGGQVGAAQRLREAGGWVRQGGWPEAGWVARGRPHASAGRRLRTQQPVGHTQQDHSMQRSRQLTTAYSSCGPSNVRSRLPVRISQMCATNCGGVGARQMRGCTLLSEWQAGAVVWNKPSHGHPHRADCGSRSAVVVAAAAAVALQQLQSPRACVQAAAVGCLLQHTQRQEAVGRETPTAYCEAARHSSPARHSRPTASPARHSRGGGRGCRGTPKR